tara:strand:- start:3166 stop:3795 length:630 start_codon:yes stop_codon:yes gene_type:complete
MKNLTELMKGKTCAVVSNSGDLVNYEYGKLIDEHDVVIRCNWSLINGYEKHVGTRTDIRFSCIHLARLINDFDSWSKDVHYNKCFPSWSSLTVEELIYDDEVIILQPNANSFKNGISSRLNGNEVYSLNDLGTGGILDYSGTNLGTGIIAILFASSFFENVSCFCFDFFKKSKEHYYEKVNTDISVSHNHEYEYNLSRSLSNVKFFPDR